MDTNGTNGKLSFVVSDDLFWLIKESGLLSLARLYEKKVTEEAHPSDPSGMALVVRTHHHQFEIPVWVKRTSHDVYDVRPASRSDKEELEKEPESDRKKRSISVVTSI